MSISNLFVPNNYNLFSNSINVTQPTTDLSLFYGPYSYFLSFGSYSYGLPIPSLLTYQPTPNPQSFVVFGDLNHEISGIPEKGYQLISISVIYQVQTQDLASASVIINAITYEEGLPLAPIVLPLTGTLPVVVTGSNLYVATLDVASPTYTVSQNFNTQITFNTQASTVLDFYGVILNFKFNYL